MDKEWEDFTPEEKAELDIIQIHMDELKERRERNLKEQKQINKEFRLLFAQIDEVEKKYRPRYDGSEMIPLDWINQHSSEYFNGFEAVHLAQMIAEWRRENEEN